MKNRPNIEKTDFLDEKQTILPNFSTKRLLNRPRSVKTDHIANTAFEMSRSLILNSLLHYCLLYNTKIQPSLIVNKHTNEMYEPTQVLTEGHTLTHTHTHKQSHTDTHTPHTHTHTHTNTKKKTSTQPKKEKQPQHMHDMTTEKTHQ